MSENIISENDAQLLFGKLISERIPVVSLFISATGVRSVLSGFVDSVSALNGIVISESQPPSKSRGILVVPLTGRTWAFSYCDARGIPSGMEGVAAKIGDTVLLITLLDPIETLYLTFKL